MSSSKKAQEPTISVERLVGIGASAGGLEALSAFLGSLEPGAPLSYVVVQHLSPTHRSMLSELLGRVTNLAVVELVDGTVPEVGTVYITPPNRNVTSQEGKLRLREPDEASLPKPSINLFLKSLAEEWEERSVAVILSGTGSDGSDGLRMVKGMGGVTLAQTPTTAAYGAMPQSAMNTGLVDVVMAPQQLAEYLMEAFGTDQVPVQPFEELSQTDYEKILTMVKIHTQLDFSLYKEASVGRRLERRMITRKLNNLSEYLELVTNETEELSNLARDILISVTGFYRDPDSFAALREELAKRISSKPKGSELRIWVPGCATGEEAYTVAMILNEIDPSIGFNYDVQIFATDVDMDALAVARKGSYSLASVDALPPEILQRFFLQKLDRYEVISSIRDLVVFARHDLVVDPPFVRLDLISCRNVLIYFKNPLQERLLSNFNYALGQKGLLFLGRSETTHQTKELYSFISKKHRLYTATSGGPVALLAGSKEAGGKKQLPSLKLSAKSDVPKDYEIFRSLATNLASPGVLTDRKGHIQRYFGHLGEYLRFPEGEPRNELFDLLTHPSTTELQTALLMAQQSTAGERIFTVAHTLESGVRAQVQVQKIDRENAEPLFLFRWIQLGESSSGDGGEEQPELAQQLSATQDHLQSVIEELETQNEEMQALNEELQASNEEMEATNEELQASNEELMTINDELQAKTLQYEQTNHQLEGILNGIDHGLLVIDSHGELLRINTKAERLFSLSSHIAGLNLYQLAMPKALEPLPQWIKSALKTGQHSDHRVVNGEQILQVQVIPRGLISGLIDEVLVTFVDMSDVIEARDQLELSRQTFTHFMDQSPIVMALKDPSGRYTFANDNFAQLLGARELPVGKLDSQLFSDSLTEFLKKGHNRVLETGKAQSELFHNSGGESREMLISFSPILGLDGAVEGTAIQGIDVTQQYEQDQLLRLSGRVIEQAAEGMVITDPKGTIINVNSAVTAVSGYTREELIGNNPRLFKSGKHDTEFYRLMYQDLAQKGTWSGEIWNKSKSGQLYAEHLSISAIYDHSDQVEFYVAVFADITELKAAKERMEFLALHDELTGLPNRHLLSDRIKNAMARAGRDRNQMAVIFIDLDSFKGINDSLGHNVGDLLLIEVARRLSEKMRAHDTVARYGGDEFVIILDQVTPLEVDLFFLRIKEALESIRSVGDFSVLVSFSGGVSMYPNDSQDPDELLRFADTAMYRAKQSGKRTHYFYSSDLKEDLSRKMHLARLLNDNIDKGELRLAFQPLVSVESLQMVSLEVLLRWDNHEMGLVSPSEFIPLCEELGLIRMVTEWVIDETCLAMKRSQAQGQPLPRCAINISPALLKDHELISKMVGTIRDHRLDPQCFTIEITENAFIQDAERTSSVLKMAQQNGIAIAMDDFGTGFSSLAMLSTLPLDEVKIDQAFVKTISDQDSQEWRLFSSIIGVVHSLGIHATAEGVETEAIASLLSTVMDQNGKFQGYHFARPMDFEGLMEWMGAKGQ